MTGKLKRHDFDLPESLTSKEQQQPACRPSLTVVVMSPTVIKHALVLYVGPMYWFASVCPAMVFIQQPASKLRQMSSLFLFDVYDFSLHWFNDSTYVLTNCPTTMSNPKYFFCFFFNQIQPNVRQSAAQKERDRQTDSAVQVETRSVWPYLVEFCHSGKKIKSIL